MGHRFWEMEKGGLGSGEWEGQGRRMCGVHRMATQLQLSRGKIRRNEISQIYYIAMAMNYARPIERIPASTRHVVCSRHRHVIRGYRRSLTSTQIETNCGFSWLHAGVHTALIAAWSQIAWKRFVVRDICPSPKTSWIADWPRVHSLKA